MKGGTPYGIEVTGYYDNDGKLMDIRTRNYIDPGKYFKKHKISLDPPKDILEQIWDLFTFDQKYTSKANKRLQNYFDPNSGNTWTLEKKYIVVNDEDDNNKIAVNNLVIEQLQQIANQKTGGTNPNQTFELTDNEKNKINEITDKIRDGLKNNKPNNITDNEYNEILNAIFNSAGFIELVKTQFPNDITTNVPLTAKISATKSSPQPNITPESVKQILDAISNIGNGLNTRINKIESLISNSSTSNSSNAISNSSNAISNSSNATSNSSNATSNKSSWFNKNNTKNYNIFIDKAIETIDPFGTFKNKALKTIRLNLPWYTRAWNKTKKVIIQ